MRNHPTRKDQFPVVYNPNVLAVRPVYLPTPRELLMQYRIVALEAELERVESSRDGYMRACEEWRHDALLYKPHYDNAMAIQRNAAMSNHIGYAAGMLGLGF